MVALGSTKVVRGMASVPPSTWRCGTCSETGKFQSGYCFGCRSHTGSITVDVAVLTVPTAEGGTRPVVQALGADGLEVRESKVGELVYAGFEDELSQMSLD